MAKVKTTVQSSKSLGVKPLSGYVLIKPSEGEEKTIAGIILPESAQEKPALGVVVSVGEGLTLGGGQYLSAPVKVGDKVFYKKWGGDEIKLGGQELKLVKFEDLIAILES